LNFTLVWLRVTGHRWESRRAITGAFFFAEALCPLPYTWGVRIDGQKYDAFDVWGNLLEQLRPLAAERAKMGRKTRWCYLPGKRRPSQTHFR
jgi:hypothetical protein